MKGLCERTGATKRKSEYASEWARGSAGGGAAGGMKGQRGSHKQGNGEIFGPLVANCQENGAGNAVDGRTDGWEEKCGLMMGKCGGGSLSCALCFFAARYLVDLFGSGLVAIIREAKAQRAKAHFDDGMGVKGRMKRVIKRNGGRGRS